METIVLVCSLFFKNDFKMIKVRFKMKQKKNLVVIDSSNNPETKTETITVQLGSNSIVKFMELIIKSMVPGEQAIVTVDPSAAYELRDIINETLEIEIELVTIVEDPIDPSYNFTISELIKFSENEKQKGNNYLKSDKFEEAIECYNKVCHYILFINLTSFRD